MDSKYKKILIVYHRIDFDGLCSCAIAKRRLDVVLSIGGVVDILGWNYGDDVPSSEKLNEYGLIFLVDLSFPVETMITLGERGGFVWIDHHETAINDAKAYGYDDVPGLREIGKGACELCWQYFFPRKATPKTVQYLSAYDVWDKYRFDWENETLPFQYGMRNAFNLDVEKFLTEFSHIEQIEDSILSQGRAIIEYSRAIGKRACNAYAFPVSIDNGKAKGLCMLTPHFGSLEMEESAKEQGCDFVVCVNRLDVDRYKVSLYAGSSNTDIHAGEYMKRAYGGGGHKGAAGGTLNRKQFYRLLNEQEL